MPSCIGLQADAGTKKTRDNWEAIYCVGSIPAGECPPDSSDVGQDDREKRLSEWVESTSSAGYIIWLVVWTPLKNMKVNWDDYSQYMGK